MRPIQPLTTLLVLFCLLLFGHRGCSAEPEGQEVKAVFDGFQYKNLAELSKKWNVRTGARLGPGANNWYGSFVETCPAEGKVRLKAKVDRGVRKASGIALRTPLPTTGTFAANVRFQDSSDEGYSSVKAFYTYAENPSPLGSIGHPNHLEHDFEIISEKHHYWLAPNNVLRLPVLKTITHEYTDPLLSRKSASHNRNKFISLSTISGDYMTLVVQVRRADTPTTMSRYLSTYTLVAKTGEIIVGQTETLHPKTISHLLAKFNVWWLNPEDHADTVNNLPADQEAQYMDIKWFYFNSASDIPPPRVAQYGALLDSNRITAPVDEKQ